MLREVTKQIVSCLLLVLAAELTPSLNDAKAGTFTLTPRYVGSFDAQNNSLGMLDLSQPQEATVDHQFDFHVELADMADGERFGAVAFNINLGLGVSQARGGWQADRELYDVGADGQSTWIAPWSHNVALNTSSSDFGDILLMMTEDSSKTTNFGNAEDGFTLLGSVFLNWDGSSDAAMSILPADGGALAVYSTNEEGRSIAGDKGVNFLGGGFQFGENAGQTAPVEYLPPVRVPVPIIEEPVVSKPVVGAIVDPVVVPPTVVDPIAIDPIETFPVVIDPVVPDPIYVDPIAEPPIIVDPLPADPIESGPWVPEPPTLPPVVYDPIVPDVVEPVVVLPPVVITPPVINPIAVDPIVMEPIVVDPIETMPEVIDAVVPEPSYVDPIAEPPAAVDPLPVRPIDEDEGDVGYNVLHEILPAVVENPEIVLYLDDNGFVRETWLGRVGFVSDGNWNDLMLLRNNNVTFVDATFLPGTLRLYSAGAPTVPEPSAIALGWMGILLLLSGRRRKRKR